MLIDGMPITSELLDRFEEVVNADENPIEFLSIDPGTANGVCGYDSKYHLAFMYTIPANNIVQVLDRLKRIKKCIVESYNLYPNKAQQQIYSDMETPRVIGRVESWAELHGVEIVKQPASIKPTAYAWVGQKALPKSNRDNHKMDAHVHFMYWAVKNGLIPASDLVKRKVSS